ncbi:hypothetical protein [Candidatus Aquiluna sp. UB-MaderosW2red]|jgi:hypothetical protein|uniref:hypothetical protein n=1 Tax=Candidatus Aquiluna sp. UB-MaderosW2red TaxID=1855377 RepID=UPI0012FC969D|nr:hypothetical protein [Candidatus Aquiluna sp. UB-MaderosW2red]
MAFIDESFLSPAQSEDSFYILTAAVIDKKRVLKVRQELFKLVGANYWHTTDAGRSDRGRQKIRELNAYLARNVSPVIVVIEQLAESDKSAEAGRVESIRTLLNELAENHLYLTGTVVYESRIPGFMQNQDRRIIKEIAEGQSSAAKLKVFGLASKKEPMLWAPDLIGWAYRHAYADSDKSFFQELAKVATVIKL